MMLASVGNAAVVVVLTVGWDGGAVELKVWRRKGRDQSLLYDQCGSFAEGTGRPRKGQDDRTPPGARASPHHSASYSLAISANISEFSRRWLGFASTCAQRIVPVLSTRKYARLE